MWCSGTGKNLRWWRGFDYGYFGKRYWQGRYMKVPSRGLEMFCSLIWLVCLCVHIKFHPAIKLKFMYFMLYHDSFPYHMTSDKLSSRNLYFLTYRMGMTVWLLPGIIIRYKYNNFCKAFSRELCIQWAFDECCLLWFLTKNAVINRQDSGVMNCWRNCN